MPMRVRRLRALTARVTTGCLVMGTVLVAASPAVIDASGSEIDASFGTSGSVEVPLQFDDGVWPGLATTATNDSFVYGFEGPRDFGTPGILGVVRYSPSGALRSSFGGNGDGQLHLPTHGWGTSSQLVPLDDGGALVLLSSVRMTISPFSVDYRTDLYRLDQSGALDATFGVDGELRLPYPGDIDGTSQPTMSLMAGGKILLTGAFYGPGCYQPTCAVQFAGRVTADGAMDATFGGDGWKVAPDSPLPAIGTESANGVLVVDRGAGGYGPDTVRRVLSDGSDDPTFAPITIAHQIREVAVRPSDGGVVIVSSPGSLTDQVDFFLADGSVDVERPQVFSQQHMDGGDFGHLVIDAQGRMFSASGFGAGVYRWNDDGSRDVGYGVEGLGHTPATVPLPMEFTLTLTSSSRPMLLWGADLYTGVGHRVFLTRFRNQAATTGNAAPDFDQWHMGDVHVHVAGDTNLIIHPQCTNELMTETTCAYLLMNNMLQRAQRFGDEFLIFTEHAPWLGFQRDNSVELYNFDQASDEWWILKNMADNLSTGTIRGLMGLELGTAAPACMDVDVTGVSIDWWGPIPYSSPEFAMKSPGHFGVYSTPGPIDDSIVDCNETGENGYVDDVAEQGGFGGINHPDNADHGSPWWCYSTGIDDQGHPIGLEHQPQVGRMEPCPVGIDQYAASSASDTGAFRTMEIISGNNLPSEKTFSEWDMFLQNGYHIAAVGGGDGHTAPRKQDVLGAITCMTDPTNSVGDCVDAGAKPGNPNHNKSGGSARTLALYPDTVVVGANYDSNNADDPARLAIHDGRTVATNGPKATAQIAGQQPGGVVDLPSGDPVQLRVDWEDSWTSAGDILSGDANSSEIPADQFNDIANTSGLYISQGDPHRIVVVTGERDGCGQDAVKCEAGVLRTEYILNPDGSLRSSTTTYPDGFVVPALVNYSAADNRALFEIDPPADGYVRVEMYWDDPNKDGETDFAAITSPIYVTHQARVTLTGRVVDPAGSPVVGAEVELCRTTPAPLCTRRTTAVDGSFEGVQSYAGEWEARAFPPANRPNLFAAGTQIGPLTDGEQRFVQLQLPAHESPAFIDPSGWVVDTNGQPIDGATVTLLASDSMAGPFLPVPDGGAMMSPDNRQNPTITGSDGAFAWDVLAGWYALEVSKPGCTATDGSPSHRSGALQVPEPVVGLHLVLDCRAPDTTAPVITFTEVPPAVVGADTGTVRFDVADAGAVRSWCLVDGGPAVDSDGGLQADLDRCDGEFTTLPLTDGAHTVTVLSSDDHGNYTTAETAFVTDTTAPEISFTAPADGSTIDAADFVEPTCTAVDANAGDVPCTVELSVPEQLSNGVSVTATASSSDPVGNTATATTTFNVVNDHAGPTVDVQTEPAPNASGWWNEPVTVVFGCSDPSGVATCPQEVLVDTDGADQPVSGQAEDTRGNTSTAGTQISLDRTPPQLTLFAPANGASVPVAEYVPPTCSASDALSGLNGSCAVLFDPPINGAGSVTYTVTATATDLAGNVTTKSSTYSVITDANGPTITAHANGAANGAGWRQSPVTFTFECTDPSSGVAGCPDPITFLAEGPNQAATVSAVDHAGNLSWLTVSGVNIDLTAPSVSISGAVNGSTVRLADYVQPLCVAADALSGLASCVVDVVQLPSVAGVAAVTITATATDVAGNTNTAIVHLDLITDATGPSISSTPSVPANGAGWWNSPVTYAFSCTDAESSVAACPSPVVFSNSAADQSATVSATDQHGNTSSLTVSGINVDTQPPSVSVNPAPGQSPPVACTASDAVSGLAGPCQLSAPVQLSPSTFQITATAVDVAGNIKQVTTTYHVKVPDRQQLLQLIDQLQALPLTGSAATARNKAVTGLTTATTLGWWTTYGDSPTTADASKVFGGVRDAVSQLAKIKSSAARSAQQRLVAMARKWAVEALNTAIASSAPPATLTQMRNLIRLGDWLALRRAMGAAVTAYKNAWMVTAQ